GGTTRRAQVYSDSLSHFSILIARRQASSMEGRVKEQLLVPPLPSVGRNDRICAGVLNPSYDSSFMASGSQRITCFFWMLRLLSRAAPAARYPKTASSTTGLRLRTEAKKFLKWS